MKGLSKFGKKFFLLCITIFFFAGGFTACGKEKIEPGVPLQELTTEYELEGFFGSVAALEDGTTFALTFIESEEDSLWHYQILQFDAQGECKNTYVLDGEYVNVNSIAVSEDGKTVYFVGQHETISMYLFAFHTDTGQIDEVCNLRTAVVRVKKIVQLGDYMYVMGQKRWSGGTIYGPDYNFAAKETLLCCSMKDGEYSPLGFEYPISIADSGKGTLMVFAYFPEEGYCIVEYDPKDASTKQKARFDECRFYDFAVCNDGNSLLYDCHLNFRGLLMADLDNLDLEIEVYDNSIAWMSDSQVWYGYDNVYFQDAVSQNLVRFPLSAVQKKNKTVRLVATQQLSDIAPYGCGYRLERIEEEWDKIALKMLAQDKDYDLCLGSSDYSKSIVIRDSSMFYPLNDLPGIEEYLEKCFPYVREAATTEDGVIWMLPFSANVYAMMVQEERVSERGIDLYNNMSFDEFAQLVCGLSEKDEGLFHVYPEGISDEFMKQYFWHNTSVQNETFLKDLENLRVLYQNKALLYPLKDVNEEILLCSIETFGRYPFTITRNGFSVYSVPKEKAIDKNNISLYYLVVNGKSKNTKEALSYLADLIAYLMKRDDLMIFKDYQPEAGSWKEQIHSLFENGEVSFAIDEDVYQKDYIEVLKSDQPLTEYVKEIERRLRLYWQE